MNNKTILLVVTLLTLSSCTFGKTTETESTGSLNANQSGAVEELNIDKNTNSDPKVNEMTDTKTDDEAVQEFEKDVEDILKLLEDNAE